MRSRLAQYLHLRRLMRRHTSLPRPRPPCNQRRDLPRRARRLRRYRKGSHHQHRIGMVMRGVRVEALNRALQSPPLRKMAAVSVEGAWIASEVERHHDRQGRKHLRAGGDKPEGHLVDGVAHQATLRGDPSGEAAEGQRDRTTIHREVVHVRCACHRQAWMRRQQHWRRYGSHSSITATQP